MLNSPEPGQGMCCSKVMNCPANSRSLCSRFGCRRRSATDDRIPPNRTRGTSKSKPNKLKRKVGPLVLPQFVEEALFYRPPFLIEDTKIDRIAKTAAFGDHMLPQRPFLNGAESYDRIP